MKSKPMARSFLRCEGRWPLWMKLHGTPEQAEQAEEMWSNAQMYFWCIRYLRGTIK